MEPNMPELWNEARLREYLGVGERFVRRICDEGRIRFILIARHRRFDPADVAAYIEAEKRGGADVRPDIETVPVGTNRRERPSNAVRRGRPTNAVRIARREAAASSSSVR